MGMFDDVVKVPAMKCPDCSEAITGGWQSKDGHCVLDQIPYWYVSNFYTSCRNCGAWIEYLARVKVEPPERPISDYRLRVRSAGKPWDEMREVEPASNC